MDRQYDYVIVGGGLAGAKAVEGIRERDEKGSILLLGREPHAPYDRPPLSKNLWLGQKTVDDIYVEKQDFYAHAGVHAAFGVEVAQIRPAERQVVDRNGNTYRYKKLLLATGGVPRRLGIAGADLDGICYFRTLDDYLRMRKAAGKGKSAVVVGGGFIGSEIAASLNANHVRVTMLFPEAHLVARVFPQDLGEALQTRYGERGVDVLAGDVPTAFERRGDRFVTRTRNGRSIESDLVIAGIGILPETELAKAAGLEVGDGILVDETLRTSDPHIYAAGDNANFPYAALGVRTRVEHWDNAFNQGLAAGRNMAGGAEAYTYMPYFFSDLFEFGYEAVGEVDARLRTVSRWQKEYDTGVVFYLRDGIIRGAMMCNVWDQVDAARELIRSATRLTEKRLESAEPLSPTMGS